MSQQESGIEVKVGALVLFALVLLAGFVFVLGDFSLSSGKRFNVVFDNAGGLKPGADVAIAGLRVGQVESLHFQRTTDSDDDGPAVSVRATVHVENAHADSVRRDSEFYISTRSVLGEPYIEVVTNSLESEPIDPGATVKGVSPPRVDLIVSKTSKLLDEFVELFRDPDVSINDFFANSASLVEHVDSLLVDNRGDLDKILEDGRKTVTNAANMLAALNYAVGEGEAMRATLRDVRRTAQNAESITSHVDEKIAPITTDLEKTTAHAREVSKIADEILAGNRTKVADSIDNVHASTKNLRKLSGNADALVRKIERGEGTVGQLLADREMYDDMRELLRIIKRQPWKIMWKE